jgi:pimeloyl-ACP methyl ester carboxylesterase
MLGKFQGMIETIAVGPLTVLRALPDATQASRAPVLFVHGYFADATAWTEWLELFAARGIPAYAVNLRGRAGSRPECRIGEVSIDDYVADAAEVARTVHARIVIGHSMGGLIAQKLAEQDVVDAAVLVTPAPPRGISVLSMRAAMRQLKYFPALLFSRAVIPGRADLLELVMNCVPASDYELVLAHLVPDSGRAGREMAVLGVPVDRARVRCPLFVVAAGDDRFILASTVARIARRYGVPLETINGHGHLVIVEPGWEQLATRVLGWIDSIPAPTV